MTIDVQGLAQRLDAAARQRHRIPMLSLQAALSLEDAYRIQHLVMDLRLARGEHLAGGKMGLTTVEKLQQLGINSPVYGRLTDAMQVSDGGTLSLSSMFQPRVEPEIAFVMGRELRGPVSVEQAWAAVAAVCPALEIVDSRYQDFRFNLADVVADNVNAAHFVLGPPLSARHAPPLDNLRMELLVDGRVVRVASSAAVCGHPLCSLQLQAQLLADHGASLFRGHIVLSGNPTDAVTLRPDSHIEVRIERLGAASFRTLL